MLPSLRERREDLIELVFFFLNRAVQKTDKRIRQIEPNALAVIEQHQWPGNIRELENAIERAVVLADGDTITLKDLPEEIRRTAPAIFMDSTHSEVEWPSYDDSSTAVTTDRLLSNPALTDPDETQRIRAALHAAGGNKAKAARALRMPRSTFYSKLKKLGVIDPNL